MMETFPRIREKDFAYQGYETIPEHYNGRLDLFMNAKYGEPMVYKIVAAANGIGNAMALRPTIRPAEESLRNELILKGYTGDALEAKLTEVKTNVILGNKDWLSYGDNVNGVITEAPGGYPLFLPNAQSAASWFQRYERLTDET